MTLLLSIDPGLNSGVALGYYDAITPYRLLERWQVHGGLVGLLAWWEREQPVFDEIVVEDFILDPRNQFSADITPLLIKGAIIGKMFPHDNEIVFQPRTDKSVLVGYPPEAITKSARQRVRFLFLARFGLFKPGTENDDSNDAICHALIYLKKRCHEPSLHAFWPDRARSLLAPASFGGASF